MTGAAHHRSWVAAALLAAAVPYVVGVVLLARHAASGEPGVYPEWREVLLETVAFALVGALIGIRRPGNRVGALLAVLGILAAVQLLGGEYQAYAAHVASALPGGDQAAGLSDIAQVGFACGFLLLLQVFPDGKLLGRRWRLVSASTAVLFSAFVVSILVYGTTDDLPAWLSVFLVPYAVAVIGSFAAPVVRWRRGDGRVRAQVKWVAFAGVAALMLIALGVLVPSEALGNWAWPVALILVPIATVIAILRYRLYDIDRVISRTASYAVVTALLLGLYFALVTTSARLLPDSSSLAVAASTLAAAALFQPLRQRVQAVVDRRFNRARYDAARTAAEFSARLRDEVDLESVRTDLLTVVHDTLQPASTGLWLRPGGESR